MPERFTAETVVVPASEEPVSDRQDRVEGFDQKTFSASSVLLVGAGNVGGEIAHGLVRKGLGQLIIADEDVVTASNLPRQRFYVGDIGANKAIALAENLVGDGTMGTELVAYPVHFEDALATGATFDPDAVVCAPDNDDARVAVAEHFYGRAPVVITGLDPEANGGYVFVQDRTGACFRCYRPEGEGAGACPGAPAVTDPAKAVAGLVLFALDSLLMDRHRAWTLTEFHLSGVIPPIMTTVDQQEDCPLCGGPS